MKILRRIAAFATCLTMIFPAVTVFAREVLPSPNITPISGRITEITNHGYVIHIMTAHGSIVHFLQTNFTFLLGEHITVGDSVTIFHDASLMTAAVYPPQYEGLLIVNEQDVNIIFGYLQNDIKYYDNIPIYFQNGHDFRELIGQADLYQVLENRLAAIIYDTNNEISKIVIMSEPERPLPGVYVNSIHLPAASWHIIHGTTFVPLRSAVEVLGFGDTIAWDNGTITLSNGSEVIRFSIGSTTAALTHPAILIDSTTFVPISFFYNVFPKATITLVTR
ncbi:MAG: copper amine oxidase N-terminal domain-containing protein [Defluviitaleaceae bacterium]|nr:copper amine oxidase N-terminal domain-containing protein [Defluviitaleaceae bacterium]